MAQGRDRGAFISRFFQSTRTRIKKTTTRTTTTIRKKKNSDISDSNVNVNENVKNSQIEQSNALNKQNGRLTRKNGKLTTENSRLNVENLRLNEEAIKNKANENVMRKKIRDQQAEINRLKEDNSNLIKTNTEQSGILARLQRHFLKIVKNIEDEEEGDV